ncbi:GNAT family N-acetyltransferase [Pseudomonas alliivorans]|uniref:GNAT family N-acetyltransferase n=1 Tax=Pseudomonas alliivorans TaxID=2810613 RepID=UPI002090BAED|nr:GNAT family N-acetyltransferase [Pseudomonas alliivorans]MCO5363857.1 GNAT family N-acetyltransferase [Pseudomonas alliivorans]MEE5121825.1 GNAT family N-acetyltransferase [Pseudomonas alliivorans]
MNLDDFILAPVDEVEQRVLETFTSGDDELDVFLKEDACAYSTHGITSTTVVFLEGSDDPVGFFSLSGDSLKLEGVELSELGLPFQAPIDFFPAVKITKLAVALDWQSRGLGEAIIQLIQGISFTLPFSARLLTVNAVNRERTIRFYNRLEFLESSRNMAMSGQRKKGRQPATVLMSRDLYQV